VVLLVCFVSLGVVLVSALSRLLDSARSGCPLWLAMSGPSLCCFVFGCAVAVSFAVCLLSAVVSLGCLVLLCCFVFRVGSAWPVLSLHRSPLLCPPFSPLVHADPVSVLLVPPSGYWLYLRRSGCHVLHCVL
jgi:hypothetical protein